MNEVLSYIQRKNLQVDDTVVVGVSGGVDSMLLLHFFGTYFPNTKVVVAHVNHGLREESKVEYEMVQKEAAKMGYTFAGTTVDVASRMDSHKESLQVAARNCRYAFYEEVLDSYKATQLYLGHHGDDLVETMLMRQTNGAYGSALAGMDFSRPFANGFIIRPFLCLSKDDIYSYAYEYNLLWSEDSSNQSNKYRRNYFRNEVLPTLKKENPKIHLRFLEQSEKIKEDETFFQSFVNEFLQKHTSTFFTGVKVNKCAFLNEQVPLQRRILKQILSHMGGETLPSNILDQLYEKINKEGSSDYIELVKGIYVVRVAEYFYILKEKISTMEYFTLIQEVINQNVTSAYIPYMGEVKVEEKQIFLNGQSIGLRKEVEVVPTMELERISLPHKTISRKKFFMENKVPVAFKSNHFCILVNKVCVWHSNF